MFKQALLVRVTNKTLFDTKQKPMNKIRNQSLPRGFVLLLLFLAASLSALAQTEDTCYNPKAIRNICMMVESRSKDPNPQGHYEYTYQRKIMDAACVDWPNDSKEVMAAKIRRMWLIYEDTHLVCNSVKFDTTNGNILKFAIASRFDQFIFNATQWGVHLNRIDEVDKLTVLDYVQKHLERHKGTVTESTLKMYYKQLRDAGAKYSWEL